MARPCLSPYLVKGYTQIQGGGAARIGMVYSMACQCSMVYCYTRLLAVSPVGVAPRSRLEHSLEVSREV